MQKVVIELSEIVLIIINESKKGESVTPLPKAEAI